MLSDVQNASCPVGTIVSFLPTYIHRLVIVPQAVGGVVCVAHEIIPAEAVTSESSVIHV